MPVLVPHPEDQSMNDPLMYWNLVALDMNRLGHSVRGPQGGPPLSARALAIVHLAIHDAYFAVFGGNGGVPKHEPYYCASLTPPKSTDADPMDVIAGAAFTALQLLYLPSGSAGTSGSAPGVADLTALLSRALGDAIQGNPYARAGFLFGRACAQAMVKLLAVPPEDPGANPTDRDGSPYIPSSGRGKFRADPSNPLATPVRLEPIYAGSTQLRAATDYHAPFYGKSARRIAVQRPHYCADPPSPVATDADYMDAFADVVARGGAAQLPSTSRTPYETVAGLYWAYDGANLLGTPPRLYNRIVRTIAWTRRNQAAPDQNTATFVRLFALVNAAMADAGILAWQEKYRFDYWRPLSGVREHDDAAGPSGSAGAGATVSGDPGWLTLGAPRTNTHDISFKPPFPAYPSGHATFGAAAFQMVRRFYLDGQKDFDPRGEDTIQFDFVSEELDGHSRELYQPYDPDLPIDDQPGLVRTRLSRRFNSLWQAIHENGASRVYLGVHWVFDAFASADVRDPTAKPSRPGVISHRPAGKIRYVTTGSTEIDGAEIEAPIGGVPLGLDIADDIFDSGLKRSPPSVQPKHITVADCKQPEAPARTEAETAVLPDATPTEIRVKQTDTNIR